MGGLSTLLCSAALRWRDAVGDWVTALFLWGGDDNNGCEDGGNDDALGCIGTVSLCEADAVTW